LRGGIAFSLGFTAVIFWYFFMAEKRTEEEPTHNAEITHP
jgi:hypothetical protein